MLELSPTMNLESSFYPKDWQKLSADDLDRRADPTGGWAVEDSVVYVPARTV